MKFKEIYLFRTKLYATDQKSVSSELDSHC